MEANAIFTNVGILSMAITRRSSAPTCHSSAFTARKSTLLVSKACLSTAAAAAPKAEQTANHSIISSSDTNSARRSGNYKPTMWDFDYIQSTNNDCVGDKYTKRFEELKMEMQKMIAMVDEEEELVKLELIDNLQRLGVSYHFKDEIMQVLRTIHKQTLRDHNNADSSLYSSALKFRVLRSHGFDVSEGILKDFKDEHGNLNQSLCEDIKGLLQLYETSFHATETENTLKSATSLTLSYLKNYVDNHSGEDNVTVALVRHALVLPLHRTMLRVETRWYINIYERMPNYNPLVLDLAKLDYNIVQATHQEELRDLSRWWKSTCLVEKLPFLRDRLVEDFFWAVGMIFEPQHGYCRKMLTKGIAFAVSIDDIYDVYGTLSELELFTHAVERWDLKAMEQLPDYMKVCYLALFNTVNELAYEVSKEQGINVLPYLTKSWRDVFKAWLQEARWYYNGYKPTLKEYMDNAWISIGGPVTLVHAFFCVTNPITKEALESLSNYPDIIRLSSTIIRLADDLGTTAEELKRGDIPKSIQCYMNEMGCSEEEAREHIRSLIKETWEAINTAQMENSLFSETFIRITKNIARAAESMYQHGDGHGTQNSEIKNRISKLLFEPIAIPIP